MIAKQIDTSCLSTRDDPPRSHYAEQIEFLKMTGQLEKFRKFEQLRQRHYRLSLTPDTKKKYNEKAAIRMRRMRAWKKNKKKKKEKTLEKV